MDGVLMVPAWPSLVSHAVPPPEDVIQVEHPDGWTRQVLDGRIDLYPVPSVGFYVTKLPIPVGIVNREEYDIRRHRCRNSCDFLLVRRNFGQARPVIIVGTHADDQGVSLHPPLVLFAYYDVKKFLCPQPGEWIRLNTPPLNEILVDGFQQRA